MGEDSENTIIISLNDDEPSDSEVENILKKYVSTSVDTSKHIDDYDGFYGMEFVPQSKKVKKNDNGNAPSASDLLNIEDTISTHNDDYVGSKNNSEEMSSKLKKQQDVVNRRKEKALEKERKLQEAELKKTAKNLEKQRKKEELEKQKSLKNAAKAVAKSTKADECIKYVTVEMDSELSQNLYGMAIKETLRKNEIDFNIKSQVLPNLVSWSRKVQIIDDMQLKENMVTENNFLLIITEKEFTEQVKKDNLTVYIQNIFSLTGCKQLTVVITDTDKCKPNQDIAVMEAQILTKTYFRFVKNVEDLGDLIMELTKSVAQIPFKLKKEEKYRLFTEYFNDTNKDTVRVDKNGNGLKRLWQQMLTMFPLARLETAEAITAVYPTPSSLFEAYETCNAKEDQLLQDLPIRRAHGPCIATRRIGPELSRKCSNFFCSTENTFL